jgi:hypothetical protein
VLKECFAEIFLIGETHIPFDTKQIPIQILQLQIGMLKCKQATSWPHACSMNAKVASCIMNLSWLIYELQHMGFPI